MDAALAEAWLGEWQRHILDASGRRFCDTETGEEIGWLVSPFLLGFHYGHLATGSGAWLDRLLDWADAWIRRAVDEPDGFPGWPKAAGASTSAVPPFVTDSLLGEAMGLRPLALAAAVVLGTPGLAGRYGAQARAHLALGERVFEKWDSRGCWREVGDGGLWVVAPFGLTEDGGGFTDGYARRQTDGFSLPANKQNLVALWLLAMHEATGRAVYRERAEAWWRLMRTRLREGDHSGRWVWNYWDPAGPWDFRPDGAPRHWVGVHPNGGYYAVDVEAMVTAYEHGLVFGQEDIARLVATNRGFMWNGSVAEPRFRRIDGGVPDPRWKDRPGCLWTALVPHDEQLRAVFEAAHRPATWGGLATTPWYLARTRGTPGRMPPPAGRR